MLDIDKKLDYAVVHLEYPVLTNQPPFTFNTYHFAGVSSSQTIGNCRAVQKNPFNKGNKEYVCKIRWNLPLLPGVGKSPLAAGTPMINNVAFTPFISTFLPEGPFRMIN